VSHSTFNYLLHWQFLKVQLFSSLEAGPQVVKIALREESLFCEWQMVRVCLVKPANQENL